MKRNFGILLISCLLLTACNWFKYKPAVGLILSEHFKNKLYRQFDTSAYNPVFLKALDSFSKNNSNARFIRQFYAANGNEPQLITRFYSTGALETLKKFVGESDQHGLNPQAFGLRDLEKLLSLLGQNKFKNIDEVYPAVARLELASAASLVNYYNALAYGCIHPKNYLTRYLIRLERPDSTSISKVLNTADLTGLLKKVQPAAPAYIALQKALDTAASDKKPAILVNLERLRWKMPVLGKEYVSVNIPDFSLSWHQGSDTLIRMKVCVGGKREEGFDDKIALWLKTRKLEDMPRNHETSLLVSSLKAIQANPVWSIPPSIGKSEIYYLALKDRFYLSNSNIKVYYKDKLVADPDTIQWAKYNREKLPFRFKQGSGAGNALGKFKFTFNSPAGIYLHDTNNRNGFFLKNRAISHGCVRIERPLEFAALLLKEPATFDKLRMEVNLPPLDTLKMPRFKQLQARRNDTLKLFKLQPKWFESENPVPLIINYTTALLNNGHIYYLPDVYGHDAILLKAMKKYTSIR